jgi:hypothetical protein
VCWSATEVDVPADIAMERPTRPAGRPDDERAEVVRWLADFLVGGPKPAAVVREAAIAQGFATRTLRRAFRDLGGVATRVEGKNEWQWDASVAVPGRATPDSGAAVPCPAQPDIGWAGLNTGAGV